MADRQSAWIFHEVFTMLAEHVPEPKRSECARKMWKLSREFDFNDYQMECDEALIKLGLARKGIDPEYPDEGEVTLYGPADTSSKESG